MKTKRAWLWILTGMVAGMGLGLLLPKNNPTTDFLIPWIALPGNLFLALLQMVMIPLVVTSVALGVAGQSGGKDLGRLTLLSLVYFAITTILAICIGIGLSLAIQPGQYVDSDFLSNNLSNTSALKTDSIDSDKSIPEILMDTFPKNPLRALTEAHMLTVVIFSLLLGLALTKIPSGKEKPLVGLLESIQEFTMVVVGWALSIAPIAVFGLMTQAISQIGWELLAGLSAYVGTVLLGLFLVLVMFLVIGFSLGGIRPLFLIARLRELQILAFSSSSSAAVLPLSLKTAIEGLHVRPRIADFVIPLGATINMNGTAIYQGIATLFLAEIFGVSLTTSQLLLLVATVVGASVGTAATPGVGIVILAGILTSFGIPTEGIAILFGVDRFLDMCRTSVNVTGDVVASKILDRVIKRDE